MLARLHQEIPFERLVEAFALLADLREIEASLVGVGVSRVERALSATAIVTSAFCGNCSTSASNCLRASGRRLALTSSRA
jgi:hypothetical protein